MLYAGFMSASLPPFPLPQEPVDEPTLLQLGSPDEEPCLRADAARNRARLLEAAARLVAQHGAAGVTMEAVAAAAQVGKGTVFRRFGDRTGLLTALLDHSEKNFQAAVITGPAPLGPGAPPLDRLKEFGVALLRRSADELELQLAADPGPERRYSNAPRRFLRGHVLILLREIVPDADCELLALTLMAYLDPATIHYRTVICGMPADRVEAGWLDLVDRITRSVPPC
ncbi:TetR/AcrR family transcriptional regulator [Streptomyces cinnabarinus]|uniref:TetR/AcrR family transcriptional regulator n=1 Tax=Streptomyces cinnabarinus TaxID=67287 RepID=A0ABY7KQ62_9ACTN|nr:TetR/AcrR family transcriptional regulator [Streptomyces cinnabarinus]WAZ25730.1 TetR/AcrR family transcriptional regulator [Streptomyces cinnabarinus]